MACNFTISFSGAATDVLSRAQSAVQAQGGLFKGDHNTGSFQVNVLGSAIKGSYIVSGQDLEVTIHSKPFLVPCSTIENFLRGQIR